MIVRVPSPGSLFAARYRIESELGRGGMGIVLGVRDEKTNVSCALKLLSSPHLRVDAARLMREARALMLISSAHVVRVFDVDEAEGIPYLVLERLEGDDLAKIAGGEPVHAEVVARWALGVCDALSQAHALGIVHRDIKLSNLFLARLPDGRTKLKLLDFGISKAAPGDAHGTLTGSHGTLGSPQYISPQQLANPKDADPRSDLWSLGVVLFRLLAARFPFEGTTAAAIIGAIREGDRPRLSDVAPLVPEEMVDVVERCLSTDEREAFASANDLADALRTFLRRKTGDDSLGPDGFVAAPSPTVASPAYDTVTEPEIDLATIPEPERIAPVGRRARVSKLIPSPVALVGLGIALPLALVVSIRSSSMNRGDPLPAMVAAPTIAAAPTTVVVLEPSTGPSIIASVSEPREHGKPRPRRPTHRVAPSPRVDPAPTQAPSAREPEPPLPAPSVLRSNPYRD